MAAGAPVPAVVVGLMQLLERVYDYRAGVALEFFVESRSTAPWVIAYTGYYGFEGDPAEHHEDFDNLPGAIERWKQLIGDYFQRAMQVNRLKAFKKDWVPPTVPEYEAVIWERDGLTAVLSSQGPRSRRKRTWALTMSAPDLDIEGTTLMMVPYQEAKDPLPEYVIKVPISRMPEEVNRAWGKIVKAYLETR